MSESDRIKELLALFGERTERVLVPPGDDAAVVQPGGPLSVTSVDSVVDGVDFKRGVWPPQAIGHKAVASALSDLAGMGAYAGEIYVAAGLPQDFTADEFAALAEGLAAAADEAGAQIAGGDITASDSLWLAVTVVGYADHEDFLVTRSGAEPGDLVVATGWFGGSALAVQQLESGDQSALDPLVLARQFAPEPRIAAGRALAANGASAMIDVSDGLARDAAQLADASGVALQIQLASLPLLEPARVAAEAAGVDPAVAAAESGEEYELLAALPAEKFEAAAEAVVDTGTTLTLIGEVVSGSGAEFLDRGGRPVPVRGYEHFD